MRKKCTKAMAVLLLAALLVGMLPPSVFAADPPKALVWSDAKKEEEGVKYTDIHEAWTAAKEHGNIKMLTDWKIESPLDVKKDENVTLYMNGMMLDRNHTNKDADISDSGGDGSAIRVGKSASLTIIGGNTDSTHMGYIENDIWFAGESGPEGTTALTLTGAVITGGGTDSDYGGAITVDGGSTLSCAGVTFAGNIADEYWGANGNGGAIKLKGEKPTLIMANCKICYNRAVGYGGGIITEATDATVSMTGTKIEHNKAELGGGIYIDNKNTSIEMDETSMISDNVAQEDGGGIYIDEESASIRGAIIKNNRAKYGGGIYICDDFASLTQTVITENKASKKGGGIYLDVYGDVLNIGNDCTFHTMKVTQNSAGEKGGGIYVETEWEDITFRSTILIKDNTSKEKVSNNMYFDGAPDDSDVVIVSSPGRDSYIAMGASTSGKPWYFSGKGGFNPRYFHSDDDNYHIAYDYDRSKLVYKEGKSEKTAEIITISGQDFAAAPTELVYSVGEEKWPVYRGYFSLTESGEGSSDDTTSFYYSDGYFFNDPYSYDTHLASTSMALVKASGTSKNGGKTDYTNKFSDIRQLLCDMGFDDSKTRVNDEYMKKMSSDSIGVIFSQKKLCNPDGSDSGKLLVPVVVRSSAYESEWAGNFNLGTEGEHKGFSIAADTVIKELDAYMEKMELSALAEQGRICFWITGFSRGGATANLVSKRLIERYDKSENKIFTYTFAAPQGGVQSEQKLPDKSYFNIHNVVNVSDFVPYVAPIEMGFKRYGVDHYLPGSNAGKVQEKTWHYSPDGTLMKASNAKYYADNESYSARRGEDGTLTEASAATYGKQRDLMIRQFMAVAGGNGFSDYFHVGTIDIVLFINGFFEETGDADVTVDEWLQDFMHYLQVWGSNEAYDVRKYLTEEKIVNDMTVCEAVADLLGMMMSSPDRFGNAVDKVIPKGFDGWMNAQKNFLGVLVDVLFTCFNVFEEKAPSNQELVLLGDDIWSALRKAGALSEFSDAEQRRMKRAFDVIIVILLRWVNWDYTTRENDYRDELVNPYNSRMDIIGEFIDVTNSFIMTGTLIINRTFFENHSTRTYEAWVRSYDSYFTDYEIKTYGKGTGYAPRYVSLPASEIAAPIPEGVENGGVYNNEVTLAFSLPEELMGGSIYYTITHTLKGEEPEKSGLCLYTDPLELTGKQATEYKITYYAMSYGVMSKKETVSFTVKPYPEAGSFIGNGDVLVIAAVAVGVVLVTAGVLLLKKGRERQKFNRPKI